MNATPWLQNYDPIGNSFLSTCAAASPVVVLLVCMGLLRFKVHGSAVLGLVVAWVVATAVFHMPVRMAAMTTLYGAAYGLFPIGWIILNVLFLHQLTVQRGLFDVLKRGLADTAPDPRIQVILIAFAFGAFIEGVAGFGAPVAITGAILMQLGFSPLHASGLALIANTAGQMVAPFINKAAIRADYLSANARQLEAVYNYQRTVLNAYTEVVNSLAKVQNYRQSIEIKQEQVAALEKSVTVARELFNKPLPDAFARVEYVDVLLATRDLLEARTVVIETKQQQLSAIVRAYQALGGGTMVSNSGVEFADLFCAPTMMQPHEEIPSPLPDDATKPPVPEILPPPREF